MVLGTNLLGPAWARMGTVSMLEDVPLLAPVALAQILDLVEDRATDLDADHVLVTPAP